MLDPALLPLLHLTDTALPTGGYAHSFGLETYCQDGRVTDAESLGDFLAMHLEGATGPGDAPAAVAARRRFLGGDLGGCAGLDATLEAMKPARELREASRQIGRQTLRVAGALAGHPALIGYLGRVGGGRAGRGGCLGSRGVSLLVDVPPRGRRAAAHAAGTARGAAGALAPTSRDRAGGGGGARARRRGHVELGTRARAGE